MNRDDEKKNEAIMKIKRETSLETLCEDCPEEFLQYMKYCRSLKFDSKPDYSFLRESMRNVVLKRKEKIDIYMDWLLKKMGK